MNSDFEKGVYRRVIIVYILHQIIFHSKIQRFSFLLNIFPGDTFIAFLFFILRKL